MIASQLPSIEQNVATVVRKAEDTLKGVLNNSGTEILDESGTILYSSCATLTEGEYYFLGLNPGGAEEGTDSIRKSLKGLVTQKKNAYLDEAWCNHHPECEKCKGQHRLQKNYAALFSALGKELHSVCASNLIFRRSRGEKDAGGWKMAEKFWPVHEEILRIVHPSAIITFGKLPFDFISEMRKGTDLKVEVSGHGNWKWRRSILETGERLIGLPHLSRYAVRHNPIVIDEIKKYVESHQLDIDGRVQNADEVVTYNGQFRDLEDLGRFAGIEGKLSIRGNHIDMQRMCWDPIVGSSLSRTYSMHFDSCPDFPFGRRDSELCDEYEGSNQRDVCMTLKLWELWKEGKLNLPGDGYWHHQLA